MATAALAVSILSAGIALGSFAVAVWQSKVQARAIAGEEADRMRQIELLREQIQDERDARLADRLAVLEVRLEERHAGWRFPDPAYPTAPLINRYSFAITNGGKAIAVNLAVWLTGDDHGEQWDSYVEEREILTPGDTWRVILGAYGPLRDEASDEGGATRLILRWEDAAGPHEEPADVSLAREARHG